MNLSDIIKDTISASQFTEDNAERIFADVRSSGPKLVMMDDVPVCVLMAPDEYIRLIRLVDELT